MKARPGQDAITEKGWIAANKWLLLRRTTQLSLLGLFLLGPWLGVWTVKGNMNSSLTLDTLPLTDPYLMIQSWFAGHALETTALVGALIVLAFYFLVGGRSYCAWVCPVNIVTDTAEWARRRLGLTSGATFKRATRYWLLAATLVVALATGVIAWELVNPVSMLYRGMIFGMGLAWVFILAVFIFDLVISRRGWCGHFCPVGAFYSLVGSVSPLRVGAHLRSACNDCMDCYAVCPEPQVITPALKGSERGAGPVILSPQCTNCGRCIDVCSKHVFRFTSRFSNKLEVIS